ncbi:formimidoylglutamate deiminase [Candidatus Mycolicibacterium alkanivorans]|uniref:Formimidoylglutamate deiminase n=1 Tax=Candidatus Mycolicibacterium alkanivorans TaxID=2954114 RepID=A0ABS9YQH5_9MYCO|nr:formimidoylglutamate deiminase [Candidatus Mycolicibacterium alkanivorans]MCI4673528.1 formimidoylglutamate deiminase [Candidatus Mycolicibacterium alkanivorans]
MTSSWWCEHAWLGDSVADRVLISVARAHITAIETGADPLPSSHRLGGLVLPGLANAHSHAFHRALRARTQRDRGSFWTWRDLMYRAADRLNPDRYRRLARAVYAEMALAGITAVGEFHYLHHDAGGARYSEPNAMGHSLIDAAGEAGIRMTLLDTCYLSAAPDGTPLADGPQQRFGDGTGERWAQRVEELHAQLSGRPGVLIGAALHSVRGVPLEQIPPVVDWSAAQGVPLHVHSSEQPAEVEQCLAAYGRTPTAVLRDVGALGPRTTAVHSTHLTPADIADLADTSTGVCFCPTTERDLGDGIGPAAALLAGSGLFSLGSDSHAVIDPFEEARAVELDERLASGRRGTISADRLLQAATRDGQHALGWSDAGALSVGSRADFVAVELNSVRTAGAGATVENVVFAASAGDVTDVVVDGRAVVANRRHLVVEDVVAELASAIGELMDTESASALR